MLGYLSQGDLGLKMGLQSRMLKHTRSHNDYLDIFLSSCSGGGKGGEDGWGTSDLASLVGCVVGCQLQCTSKSDFRLRPLSGVGLRPLKR